MTRAIVLVLDSLGIGAAPDARAFGDEGSNTLGHIAQAFVQGSHGCPQRPLEIPNLTRLGLMDACLAANPLCSPESLGLPDAPSALSGAYAWAKEISSGKDTPSGHWELAGVPVLFDWGYFEQPTDSFPAELIDQLCQRAHLSGILGNCHASGTTILEQLGVDHIRTGLPICYTSADSVFQIAAHETHFGLDKLYALCEIARELLLPYNIGRVIARPFIGEDVSTFARTGNRKDYAIEPPKATVLKKLTEAGGQVHSVGKIADIYAHTGISHSTKATGFDELFDATLAAMASAGDRSLVMSNFVDFDSSFGHRRDVKGYGEALEAFDKRLPEIEAALRPGDCLILTADHGCDPTWPGTEHTREYVPILVSGAQVTSGSLGERSSFADVGQSLADWFQLDPMDHGHSFVAQLTGTSS